MDNYIVKLTSRNALSGSGTGWISVVPYMPEGQYRCDIACYIQGLAGVGDVQFRSPGIVRHLDTSPTDTTWHTVLSFHSNMTLGPYTGVLYFNSPPKTIEVRFLLVTSNIAQTGLPAEKEIVLHFTRLKY